ncbi:MAG: hypothetical protein HYY17_06235 [Planctomycetes bacterium]|nr:hypothetical protein [Planctomycetota bacterium]
MLGPTLAALLTVCCFQDEGLRERLDGMELQDVARLCWFQLAKDGVALLRARLASHEGLSDDERSRLEKALKELEPIFDKHDEQEPGKTLHKLFASRDEVVNRFGYKIVTETEDPDLLRGLDEVNPALVAKAAEQIRRRRDRRKTDTSPEEITRILKAKFRSRLDEWELQPQTRQEVSWFVGMTNENFGNDLQAWKKWFSDNSDFLACEPRVWQSATGAGILHVDQEAKACGISAAQWAKLPRAERERRLTGRSVPEGWRSLALVVEARKGRHLQCRQYDDVSVDVGSTGPGLPYWLFWQKKKLQSEASGWGIRILVEGDADDTRPVADRCRALGVSVTERPGP